MTTSTTTTRAEFDGLLADHRVVPVVRALFADSETRSASTGSSPTVARLVPPRVGRSGRPLVAVVVRRRAELRRPHAGRRPCGLDRHRHPRVARGRLARRRPARRTRAPARAVGDAAGARHSAARRRDGRVHRVGGRPAARAPAERARRGLRRPRAGARVRLRARRTRPPHRARPARRERAQRRRRRRGHHVGGRAGPARPDAGDLVQPTVATVAEAFDIADPAPTHRSTPDEYMAAVERSKTSSATGTSSRSSSRSGSTRRSRPTRSTSTGCCGCSTRARHVLPRAA